MAELNDVIIWLTEHWDELDNRQRKYIQRMISEKKDNTTYIFPGQVTIEDSLKDKNTEATE